MLFVDLKKLLVNKSISIQYHHQVCEFKFQQTYIAKIMLNAVLILFARKLNYLDSVNDVPISA
jgi:hypothetical protein